MKRAFILRGLPGSGKSLLARILAAAHFNSRVLSTDQYFMVDDKYQFDAGKLNEYHARNLVAFIAACRDGCPAVILDNTNTQYWEFEAYVEVAKCHGYMVHVITVGQPKDPHHIEECARRNEHGVPFEIICKMSDRFQP